MHQLEIPFNDPPGFEDLARYVGMNIAKSEYDYVKIVGKPTFHWRTGEWRALANLNGTLSLISLNVRRV